MEGMTDDAIGDCSAGKPERWVHSQSKRPHSHDVRTLCVARLPDQDPVLISGGNPGMALLGAAAGTFAGNRISEVRKEKK